MKFKSQKHSRNRNAWKHKEVDIISIPNIFEDRITSLPISVKTKILSCLPTKDAVMTSILSKKWKRSWTSVTSLDFDDKLVMYPYDNDDGTLSTEDFTSFVNRVLLLRDRSCLQKFRMQCYERYQGSLVNAWIAVALLSNVQEIDFSVPIRRTFLLPSDIFFCKTLAVLKLDTKGHVSMPTIVYLPNLKTIHLIRVEFSDDVSINSLLSGCPALEELYLRQCIGDDVRQIKIIAPSLTNLFVEELPYDKEGSDGDYKYEIVLDTPVLQLLNFNDKAAKGYKVKSLNHLMKAVITVGTPPEDINGDYSDKFIEIRSKAIAAFLSGISQVRSLVLTYDSMKAIHLCDPALPVFSNLTCMEIITIDCIGWRILPKLLENSPSLETLSFQQGIWLAGHVHYYSTGGVPPCHLPCLKVVKIGEFEGFEDEMHIVEYFLKNAKALEKLTINYRPFDNDTERNNKFFKNLLMLPRSSTICKVEVL